MNVLVSLFRVLWPVRPVIARLQADASQLWRGKGGL